MKRLITRAAMAAAASFGLMGLVQASPARAQCLQADIYVTRSSAPPTYLSGPNSCVVPTPWNQTENLYGQQSQGGLPTGTPNGAGFNVWVPAP